MLVSQCRPGSSVVRELFNQRRGVTYLYEPIYPLRTADAVQAPDELISYSTALVNNIIHSKFNQLPKTFRTAIESTENKDLF